MKAKFYLAAVISGLLVASCAGGQNPLSTSSDPSRATYQVLATGETRVSYTVSTAEGVTTSPWYPLSNIDDGNLSTAWGPSSSMASLYFDLAETCSVDAVSTKVSVDPISSPENSRVSLDVYAWVDDAWVLIGDDLTPPETVMTSLDVTDTVTDRIRVDFNTEASGQLLVCAVDILCAPMPTPRPTPTPVPTPPSLACGDYDTFTQGGWGARPRGNNPGTFLHTNWTAITGGTLVVGVGNTLTFTDAQAVTDFLPSGGKPGTLSDSGVDVTGKTSAGVFAAQVTALELNVRASAYTTSGGEYALGDLVIGSGAYAGMTVSELLALAEAVLGGDLSALPEGETVSSLNDMVTKVNEAFVGHDDVDGTVFECPAD